MIGDLAIKNDDCDFEDIILDNDVAPNDEDDEQDSDEEEKLEEDKSKLDNAKVFDIFQLKIQVTVITSENISQFSSYDLVMPIVGREVEYRFLAINLS